MRKLLAITLTLSLLLVFCFGFSSVLAAKPQSSGSGKDVIALSNGFPSGAHFNLNIHEQRASFVGDSTPGGNSVFILEYGESTIQYVTNKKASLTQLYVLDPLAEYFDGDPVKVQLPYEPEGYYVFARILGKPNNGQLEPVSNIILYPNSVVAACNDTDPANPDFPGYTECPNDPLLALGLIVGPNLYIVDPETEMYVRFDPEATKGKGKSKATDITRLFTYTGWVVDARLDLNEDGVIGVDDIPEADYDGDGIVDRDYNQDGVVDEDDVEAWLTDMSLLDPPMAWYFAEEWILNIADLVITEQGLVNDGTKLLQVRFYPVATTEFIEE